MAEGKVGRKGQGCNQMDSEEAVTGWPYAEVRVPLTNVQAKGDGEKRKVLPKTNPTQHALNSGIVSAILSYVIAACHQSSLVNKNHPLHPQKLTRRRRQPVETVPTAQK